MKTVAPAKINWTLEVLGRREDGYHEIKSVMQTIDLCDELWVEASENSLLETEDWKALGADDLVVRAVKAVEERVRRALPVRARLVKRIPAASGLGGGSSDAAAVMRCVNRLHGLGLSTEDLAAIGAGIGSDVPFFVYGGTAFVEGRGERITSMPDVPTAWLVLLVPPIEIPEKTRRMYQACTADHFGEGSYGEALTQRLQRGESIRDDDLYNAFERVAYTMFEGLATYRDALLSAGAEAAHLAGAGPALFALAESETAAKGLADRIRAQGAKVIVTRTMTAGKATAVSD